MLWVLLRAESPKRVVRTGANLCLKQGFAPCKRMFVTLILSRKGFCRNPRGIFPNKVLGEFCGAFFGGLFGIFPCEHKTGGRNPPKNPRRSSNQNCGQNPHCKDPALTFWRPDNTFRTLLRHFWAFLPVLTLVPGPRNRNSTTQLHFVSLTIC